MSVIVSMLNLVPDGMGGSETYARELLRELGPMPLDLSTLVAPVAQGFSQEVREVVAKEYPVGRSSGARARALLLGQLRRRRLARYLAGASVVHYPLTVPLPPVGDHRRSVVSLLDVQHRDLPQLFSLPERIYRRLAYDRAAVQADAVITLSEFSKRRILHHLGMSAGRVHVAHLGVRLDEFTPASGGSRDSFLLYPARAWPHKNHRVLFQAFCHLRRRHPTLRLVLTGARAADLSGLPDGVEARGLVPPAELRSLYSRAALLVFPSTYEGFGLPVIEAMASGCVVATSDCAALPEVVADAGVLFNAADPLDVARGVEEALDRSAELRPRGYRRARDFSWRRCADVHLQLYQALGA